jgi:hypothetical protein
VISTAGGLFPSLIRELGSADGLVEITIDPPCRTERCLSTFFRRTRVSELIVSLVDPDGFIAVVQQL